MLEATVTLAVCLGLAVAVGGMPEFARHRVVTLSPMGRTGSTTTSTNPPLPTSTTILQSATTEVTPPSRRPGLVRVRIYNGSQVAGYAARLGTRLKGVGYIVLTPGLSPATPPSASAVGYREGYAAEAAALAAYLGLSPSSVAPISASSTEGLGDATVAVIVADDLARA
jgi:hypothetical protein